MKWNFKRELARKFVHLLSIFILVIYFFVSDFFSKQVALIILVFILIIFLELEYLRLEIGRKIPFLKNVWKYVRRKKEKDKLGGDVFFLIGAILVLAVFDLRIAVAAILMTTFGDMAAALFGSRFGKHYISCLKEKAWEGIVPEFVVDFLIGIFVFFVLFSNPINSLGVWVVILAMATTATFTETVVSKIDDNLLIPIFSAFNGTLAFYLVNLFLR